MEKLRCQAGVEYKGKIIFSASTVNGLMSLDLDSGDIKFIKVFEKEDFTSGLYREAFLCGNEAWFIPAKAENIVCVNLDTYEIRCFAVPYNKQNKHNNMISYIYSFEHGDSIFCVPRDVDTAVRINMITHTIEKYDGVIDPYNDHTVGGMVTNNEFRLYERNKKQSINIDIRTANISVSHESIISDSIIYLYEWGDYCFKSYREEKIALFEHDFLNEVTIELSYPEEYYYGIARCDGQFLLLPVKGKHFIIADYRKGRCKELNADDIPSDVFADINNKMGLIRSNNGTYITTEYTGYILKISDDRIERFYSLEWNSSISESLIDACAKCGRLEELYGEDVIYEDGKTKSLNGLIELAYSKQLRKDEL